MKKICTKCKVEKELEFFGNLAKAKDGKKTQCLECTRAYDRSDARKETRKPRRRKNERERYKTDPSWNIQRRMRSIIYHAIKGKRTKCFEELTGFPHKVYQDKFGPMLFPGCELDHIIPQSLYDFTNPEHLKKCNHPDNLRIISQIENLRKHDKLDMELIREHKIEHLLP